MKRIVFLMAASAALVAAPALAQEGDVVGTVEVTGSVASKCVVIGEGVGQTFSDTFALGALDDTDGTLGTISNQSTSFRVNCTKANPAIKLEAGSLVNTASAPTGFTNTVRYTAYADFATQSTTTSATKTLSVDTAAETEDSDDLDGAFLANTGNNNVTVRAESFNVANATDILVAGDYTSTITVTITPAS